LVPGLCAFPPLAAGALGPSAGETAGETEVQTFAGRYNALALDRNRREHSAVAPFARRGVRPVPCCAWAKEDTMAQSVGPAGRSARCIAVVGPYLSGKTTLLEAILARTGTTSRQGTIKDGTTIGDSSAEARAHGMSVEIDAADVSFLGDTFTFIDCPGSIEFQHESAAVLDACDAAIVVTEPDEKRLPALQMILRMLEERGIPHFLFLNKIDTFDTRVREAIALLQPASTKPLVLRQIPIWENGIAVGYVDLAHERAYVYKEHAPSELVEMPKGVLDREKEARFHMLEQLADYDDSLMEQLLSDMPPPRDQIFDDLAREMREGLICPVFIGSAEKGNGIVRLLKALRHEVPFVDQTVKRLGLETARSAVHLLKTMHTGHGGKLSIARVLAGDVADGTILQGAGGSDRVAGVFSMFGQEPKKRGTAKAGDTVALAKLESLKTGETVTTDGTPLKQVDARTAAPPVYAVAIGLENRKDEVKLSSALARLVEEDPSLTVVHDPVTHQLVLSGQGEMHLRVALERLKRKYAVAAVRQSRQIPYKETIRKGTTIHARHKKQSGGHGQFGDVTLDIKPRQRGEGFLFRDTITGGVVPKQFIPSVEIGVQDYLQHGPLGFPVVDVEVVLTDGKYHDVDSSDMAFRQAGRLAMSEGMPQCSPVLLEPIMHVDIAVPSDATASVTSMIPQRRGRILGYDARRGWLGWDVVSAEIPEAEMDSLIVEVRSMTQGVGSYTARFDHLAELTGRLADQVLAKHKEAAE
jgi:elongation factor G